MNQIRQGDILLVATDKKAPAGLKPKQSVTLAEGEVTGHCHTLTGKILEWNVGTQRYVQVLGKPGYLYHPDHDPQPVAVVEPEQTYQVIRQQEFGLSEQWRKVLD